MPSHLDLLFGSIFDRFLLPTWTPRTCKIEPPLQREYDFSKNRSSKLASIFSRFWCQHASILPPKIHQNPSKNRFQDASFFRSIFCIDFSSILLRFGRPTWSHVGHFFAQNTGPANEPWVVYVGSVFFFGFLGVLAPSWRPLGSIWEGSGLHFGGFWYPFSSEFPSFLHPLFQQP